MYDDEQLKTFRLNYLKENEREWYRLLVEEGRLEAHLQARADGCRQEAKRLVAQGITFESQAWQWAIRSKLLDQEWD